MHATVSSLNVENLRNSNVKTDFQEYIGWEGAVFERLKASNNKQIEYVPCIPNYLSIFYKQSKGCKNMYYVLIDKKESIRSVNNWTETVFVYTEKDWKNF